MNTVDAGSTGSRTRGSGKRTRSLRLAAACGFLGAAASLLGVFHSPQAVAQSGPVTRLSGSGAATWGQGGNAQYTFSCQFASDGSGSCVGSEQGTWKNPECSNALLISGDIRITGLDLSRPGPIQGTYEETHGSWDHQRNADGTCTIIPASVTSSSTPFTGTWDGSQGTLVFPPNPSLGLQFTGTIKGDRPPAAFPMTVTSNITPTSATATAEIQFRAQDVGTTASVYVFAVAPSDRVRPAAAGPSHAIGKTVSTGDAKADPVACVLAQLNTSGQLQAVSTSDLQAYVTGVLSAQRASVTILNGIPTVNVGGATFYVGYGATANAMISSGVNRSAVTVPGTRECRPQPPQTGWWWNPQQGGRGFSIEASGNNLFMATYLYDASGRATWYVATGPTSVDGSLFSNQLLAFGGGVTLNGPYRSNTRLADAGPVALTFDDATHGTLVWPGATVALQRYEFGSSGIATGPLANQPESGWWWAGASDNGRGFFIEWQGGRVFLAGYMYDTAGNATWYAADTSVSNARALQSTWLQFANGQTMSGPYRAPSLVNTNVAPVVIQFTGSDTGFLTLPSGTIPISRFRF